MQSKQIKSSLAGRMQRLVAVVSLAVVLSPVLAIGLTLAPVLNGTASPVYAQDPPQTEEEKKKAEEEAKAKQTPAIDEAELKANIDKGKQVCDADGTNCVPCPAGQCIITKYINPAINTVAAMVGIAVTISIIVAGIRYATSADNPQKVSEAKQRIVTSIMVLIGFFLFYAFLNYVIPGGVGGP